MNLLINFINLYMVPNRHTEKEEDIFQETVKTKFNFMQSYKIL